MDILDDLFELFVVASVAALAPMISALIFWSWEPMPIRG